MKQDADNARAPERRDRIVAAALECIVAHGVAGTSMRQVADAADVALGSISYYFGDKEALLSAAFIDYTENSVREFRAYYDGVDSLEAARAATTRMLTESADSRHDIILGSELYSLSLRRPRHRMVLDSWTKRCRDVIAEHFDADTTFVIDALYEGILLHRSMRLGEYSDGRIALAVERLTPPETYLG
ncbi:TetR/AcrR family transcriptional regulator [uncultured Corynebacterium sp.]|uniref:TetR/AcrR family transcriptional regulator n=1 Tax=uncultured Corynebacterium sp. TaxID=159447 RepID=UPI0025D87339|nr:TetR family transcriptional regulator [uncultured Corynebacterium sp.]